MSSSSRRICVTRCRWPRPRPWVPRVRSIRPPVSAAAAASSSARRAVSAFAHRGPVRADRLSGAGPILGRERLDRLVDLGHGRAPTLEVLALERVELVECRCARDRGERRSARGVEPRDGVVDVHRLAPSRALTRRFEAQDRGGHRHVERLRRSGHGNGDRTVETRRGAGHLARAPRCRPRTRPGRRGRRASGALPARRDRAEARDPVLAQRRHRGGGVGHLHHRHAEHRAGRRPHDLGVAHVDALTGDHDRRRRRPPPRCARSCRGCRDRRRRPSPRSSPAGCDVTSRTRSATSTSARPRPRGPAAASAWCRSSRARLP